MCSVDLVARAPIMNMKQFNGKCGCCYCEDEGVPLPSTHLHRTWPYSATTTLRTHRRMIANARSALRTKEPVINTHNIIRLILGNSICLCTYAGERSEGSQYSLFTPSFWPEYWDGDRRHALCFSWSGWQRSNEVLVRLNIPLKVVQP